jgi:hypothetical protein
LADIDYHDGVVRAVKQADVLKALFELLEISRRDRGIGHWRRLETSEDSCRYKWRLG